MTPLALVLSLAGLLALLAFVSEGRPRHLALGGLLVAAGALACL